MSTAAASTRDGLECTLAQLCALQAAARALNLSGLYQRAVHPGAGRRSPSRGRGIDYVESRVYVPGDDIRNMDWRVTARSGRPHTKLYQEESSRHICLLVDFGASMFFGAKRVFKSVAAAEAAALLCWAAVQQGTQASALVSNGARELHVRGRPGRRGALAILQALVTLGHPHEFEARQRTSISALLARARHLIRPGKLIPVISDFAGLAARDEEELARLGEHNQVLLVQVFDMLEAMPPPSGRYAITDGDHTSEIDTGSAAFCANYRQHFDLHCQRLQAIAERLAMPLLRVTTAHETAQALAGGLTLRRSTRRVGRGYRGV